MLLFKLVNKMGQFYFFYIKHVPSLENNLKKHLGWSFWCFGATHKLASFDWGYFAFEVGKSIQCASFLHRP